MRTRGRVKPSDIRGVREGRGAKKNYYICVRKGFFLDMKKYLIIALSLLAVLMGAVACEKQGAAEEEEPVVGASSKPYSCYDKENGIKWDFSFINNSMCRITAKTSNGTCRLSHGCSFSNMTFKFDFPFEIPADKSASGKDEKYFFLDGRLKDEKIIIDFIRYNDDGSRGAIKQYTFI